MDNLSELNSDDATRRKRAIHLLGQLLIEKRLPPREQTAVIFFEFFSKRLGDFMITEELLKVMISLDKTYHAEIIVVSSNSI